MRKKDIIDFIIEFTEKLFYWLCVGLMVFIAYGLTLWLCEVVK